MEYLFGYIPGIPTEDMQPRKSSRFSVYRNTKNADLLALILWTLCLCDT